MSQLTEQLISQSEKAQSKLSGLVESEHGLTTCIAVAPRDGIYVIPTIRLLVSQLGHLSNRIIIIWNESNTPEGFVSELNFCGINSRVWQETRDGDFINQGHVSNIKNNPKIIVELINQHPGKTAIGKLGAIHSATEFITQESSFKKFEVTKRILMLDAESRVYPSALDLVKHNQDKSDKSKLLTCATVRNCVYSGGYPSPNIPFSLYYEIANARHQREKYFAGGAYVGDLPNVLGTLCALHSLIPGVVAEDAALATINTLRGGSYVTLDNTYVYNKIPPIWDIRSQKAQIYRWRYSSKVVDLAINRPTQNKFENDDPEIWKRAVISAILAMFKKAANYQLSDCRALPHALLSFGGFSLNHVLKKIGLSNPEIQLDRETLYKPDNARW